MLKLKPHLFLFVAVTIAFITSLIGYNYLKRSATRKILKPPEKVSIVVAIRDIQAGTILVKDMMKNADYLKESLPEGYFVDSNNLTGRVLIQPVRAKEPLLESRLAPIDVKTGGVSALINHKKRAVAVKVDKVIGVAGFIHSGNRVDVLVTIEPQRLGQKSEPITKIVLENVLVLASGQEFGQKTKDEKSSPVDVITLEVTPEEAEKLALAATEGKLQLALRNLKDTEEVLTKGTTISHLLEAYSRKEAEKPIKATFQNPVKRPVLRESNLISEGQIKFTVELIKGNKISKVNVEGRE